MKLLFPKFDKVGAPLLGLAATALFILQLRHRLRKQTRPLPERFLQNGSVAAMALPVLRLLLLPVMYETARLASKHKLGITRWLNLPKWTRYSLGFLLLDYSNYLWHLLLHKSTLLWRFHSVHHSDLDLDISTAWRFHIGENIVSIPYRSFAVAVIGAPAPLVLFYEVVFEGCTAFHHSNWRLPFSVERRLCQLMVTPRMHGIHHSIIEEETGSNFSVIFSCWDRLHRTLRLNVRQNDIVIGVPAYRSPAELRPDKLFMLPFMEQRPWELPNGQVPHREYSAPLQQLLP